MSEKLSHEEIKERLRTSYSFDPMTPGLNEAARELIRPIIEKMDHQEIIYVCHDPKLMRVDYLETDNEGFRAVATPLQDVGYITEFFESRGRRLAAEAGLPPPPEPPLDATPLDICARWTGLRMGGSAICMNMLTDHFYPDPAVVAEVKAAVAGGARREISAILERASSNRWLSF